MAHLTNLLPLKLLVISLGALLLGAIIFVLTVIVTRADSDTQNTKCENSIIHLGNAATVMNIIPEGEKLQIVTQISGEHKILTYDRCTGLLLQTVTITP